MTEATCEEMNATLAYWRMVYAARGEMRAIRDCLSYPDRPVSDATRARILRFMDQLESGALQSEQPTLDPHPERR